MFKKNKFQERFGIPMKKAQKLGDGKYGIVFKVNDVKHNGQPVAVKVVAKSKLKLDEDKVFLQNEMRIHPTLSHPSICRMFDSFEDPKTYYLVLEYLAGGELFDRIKARGGFSEKKAVIVARRVLGALQYMHSRNIVHRDMKPENLLLVDKENDTEVKLADFGLAAECTKPLMSPYGTLIYIAPEIIRGEAYQTQIDLWSFGVVTYMMLCGYPPFYSDNDQEMARRITTSRLGFLPDDWSEVSAQAKDFLKQLLNRDPKERLTAEAALQHEWLNQTEEDEVELKGVANKYKEWEAHEMLRRAMHGLNAMSKLTSMLSEEPEDDQELNAPMPPPPAPKAPQKDI